MDLKAASLSLLLIAALGSVPAEADSWPLPTQKQHYSPNERFYLEVTPKRLDSQLQYFEDQVSGKKNAGAAKGEKATHARGALYVLGKDGKYSRQSQFRLLNEVAPVDALVSDQGDYIVTLDNWHRKGYGDNVIVIYRADGSVVSKLGLGDFLTAAQIEKLPRTVSSIWWRDEAFIDEEKRELVIAINLGREDPFEPATSPLPELRIDLSTGQVRSALRKTSSLPPQGIAPSFPATLRRRPSWPA